MAPYVMGGWGKQDDTLFSPCLSSFDHKMGTKPLPQEKCVWWGCPTHRGSVLLGPEKLLPRDGLDTGVLPIPSCLFHQFPTVQRW